MKKILITLSVALIILVGYLYLGPSPRAENIAWGVDFSQKHAQALGLNWREVFLALLNELEVKNLKLSTTWDLLEPEPGNYNFSDLDWQLAQAQSHGARAILVMGMKTPRWPECHLPSWAKSLPEVQRKAAVLNLLNQIVSRYQDNSAVWAWQVENEPLFPFGECPKADKDFLKKEVELVKKLDPFKKPVIISDSGEWSFWFEAAKIGDIVGTTLYRQAWFAGFPAEYPFPPLFYAAKTKIIDSLFHKKVIGVELQAEPWGKQLLYDLPLTEQRKLMTVAKFRDNIEFAAKAGPEAFYLWGAEWWYWLKEKQGDDSFWREAKKLFIQNNKPYLAPSI